MSTDKPTADKCRHDVAAARTDDFPGGWHLASDEDAFLRNGCRAMAEKLARRRPDAQFDDDDLAGLFEIPDEVSR